MNKRRAIEIVVTIVFIICLLMVLNHVFMRKDSRIKYDGFYEKSEEYEVLFFGTSIVHYSVYPMQLWKDYGIKSYNMANDSERIHMTYYTIKNALDYATPKLIVVDLSGMAWAGGMNDGTLKDHVFLDSVPLSANKMETIKNSFEKERWAEFIVPFTLYHSRWSELTMDDFFVKQNVKYGSEVLTGTCELGAPTEDTYDLSRTVDVELERENINNIIELCEKNNIELLFTYAPCPARGGDQKIRENCQELMRNLEQDYVDLLWSIEYDWENDFIADGHMNYYGGEKNTDYIGKYIIDNYGEIIELNNSLNVDEWNKDYEKYQKSILKNYSNSGHSGDTK